MIGSAEKYPRLVKPGFVPFDPLWLAQETEKIVGQGDARKYTDFYCTGVYGGISTGYTVGCCLRCIFCWVDFARDYPERHGGFYSAAEAAKRLMGNARRRRLSRLRISGGEPTLCREHLLGVLEHLTGKGFEFILETNGIPLGADPDYARELARYDFVHVRVSIKAGDAAGFQARTGARGEFWELPFQAVEHLRAAGVSFHVAAMTDPRLMSQAERAALIKRLREAGYRGYLEEELCDPYRSTLVRLKAAGWEIFTQDGGR